MTAIISVRGEATLAVAPAAANLAGVLSGEPACAIHYAVPALDPVPQDLSAVIESRFVADVGPLG